MDVLVRFENTHNPEGAPALVDIKTAQVPGCVGFSPIG